MSSQISLQPRRPIVLLILDGWGWDDNIRGNTILQARTPSFDQLWRSSPHSFLDASGKHVGLPENQAGNSEASHITIGSGRIVTQNICLVNQMVTEDTLSEAAHLQDFIAVLKKSGGTCHLLGMVSRGSIHSHLSHGIAIARILAKANVPVAVHAIVDGRDRSGDESRADLSEFAKQLPDDARIVTLSGRAYTMDRGTHPDRLAQAYAAIALGEGARFASVDQAMKEAASMKTTEEFIVPSAIAGFAGMQDGDGLLTFNVRADRMKPIATALVDPAFKLFPRKRLVVCRS